MIDSGASHSLLDEQAYRRISGLTLEPSGASLQSVTGQPLNILCSTEITFCLAKGLTLSHRFHVVRDLQPQDAILGLDFLANREFEIHHDLSNYLLHVKNEPIRLYDAKHHQPCSTIIPVTLTGRRQFLAPWSLTFVRGRIPAGALQEEVTSAKDHMEFHPNLHNGSEGLQTLGCILDAKQLKGDNFLIPVLNYTNDGVLAYGGEALGFLTKANTQPFFDGIASVMRGQKTQAGQSCSGSNEQTKKDTGPGQHNIKTREGDRPNPGKDPPDATKYPPEKKREFLEAFRYGDLTNEQRSQVEALLWEFRDCFAMEGDPLGRCTKVIHDIPTITDEPVTSQPYRVPKSLEHEVRRLVQKMLDDGLIRKSHSEYSSPVVLVEKPDKSIRFCVNYQRLNAISRKKSFPLPNPDELLAKIGENQLRWFSTSDMGPLSIRSR